MIGGLVGRALLCCSEEPYPAYLGGGGMGEKLDAPDVLLLVFSIMGCRPCLLSYVGV